MENLKKRNSTERKFSLNSAHKHNCSTIMERYFIDEKDLKRMYEKMIHANRYGIFRHKTVGKEELRGHSRGKALLQRSMHGRNPQSRRRQHREEQHHTRNTSKIVQ